MRPAIVLQPLKILAAGTPAGQLIDRTKGNTGRATATCTQPSLSCTGHGDAIKHCPVVLDQCSLRLLSSSRTKLDPAYKGLLLQQPTVLFTDSILLPFLTHPLLCTPLADGLPSPETTLSSCHCHLESFTSVPTFISRQLLVIFGFSFFQHVVSSSSAFYGQLAAN